MKQIKSKKRGKESITEKLAGDGPPWLQPLALQGGNETFSQELDRYISYFEMPNYQKVLGGRPLVFLFGKGANASDLVALRDATKKALGVEPYITSMNRQVIPGVVDAVSAYTTTGGTQTGGAYEASIAKPESHDW